MPQRPTTARRPPPKLPSKEVPMQGRVRSTKDPKQPGAEAETPTVIGVLVEGDEVEYTAIWDDRQRKYRAGDVLGGKYDSEFDKKPERGPRYDDRRGGYDRDYDRRDSRRDYDDRRDYRRDYDDRRDSRRDYDDRRDSRRDYDDRDSRRY